MLSGLRAAPGVVVAAKADAALKHVEFVRLGPGKALVIMVCEDGQVENRVMTRRPGCRRRRWPRPRTTSTPGCAAARWTRPAARCSPSWKRSRRELDALTQRLVEAGLATLCEAARRRRRRADRARPHPICSRHRGRRPISSACGPVRRHRAQGRADRPCWRRRAGRRRAHLHRLGEPAVLPFGFLHRRRALCRCRRARLWA